MLSAFDLGSLFGDAAAGRLRVRGWWVAAAAKACVAVLWCRCLCVCIVSPGGASVGCPDAAPKKRRTFSLFSLIMNDMGFSLVRE